MPHVSFSSLKNWDFCPFYHKLTYIDKIRLFQGNVYTAFGTALHETCEKLTLNESVDYESIFKQSFKDELTKLKDIPEEHAPMILDMKEQGLELASMILTVLNIKFPGYKVVSAEEEIVEPIVDCPGDYDYKGFLDLVIKNVLGLYFIIFPSRSISLPVFLSSLSLKNHKQITSLSLLNSRKSLKNSKPILYLVSKSCQTW